MTMKKYFLLSNFQNKCLAYNWNKFFYRVWIRNWGTCMILRSVALYIALWLFKSHKLFVKDLLPRIYRPTQQFFTHIEYYIFMLNIYKCTFIRINSCSDGFVVYWRDVLEIDLSKFGPLVWNIGVSKAL